MAKGWSKSPVGFADVARDDLNKRLRATGLELLSKVIERSPVKSGRFRGANVVSLVAPNYSAEGSPDKSGNATLAAGAATIQQAEGLIYIQNNLPYASELERGTSKQAPGGIYRLAMNDVKEGV